MWMFCSTPTILSLFLQGSVVKPKVWTALTAWIWRASHFWLSRYMWDGISEKKTKNHHTQSFWFFYITIVFICVFQHSTIFISPWNWQETKQRFFHQWLSSEISQRSLKWEIFLQAYHPNLQGSPVQDLFFL